jgi:hypothetical protein
MPYIPGKAKLKKGSVCHAQMGQSSGGEGKKLKINKCHHFIRKCFGQKMLGFAGHGHHTLLNPVHYIFLA